METWMIFWKYAYIVGLGLFYLLALFLIPFGIRNIFQLSKKLGNSRR